MVCTRLKHAAPASLRISLVGDCLVQIIIVGVADTAADFLEVEPNIVAFLRWRLAEKVAAERLAIRATESLAAPDRTDGVQASHVLAAQTDQPLVQFGLFADRFFNTRRFLRPELFLQKSEQFNIAELSRVAHSLLGIVVAHGRTVCRGRWRGEDFIGWRHGFAPHERLPS